MIIRGTHIIAVPDSGMNTNIPEHFTSRYGVMNEETGNLNQRTWAELIADENYKLGHAGTPTIVYEGQTLHLVSLHLCPIAGDFTEQGAFKMGLGHAAPVWQVMNWQEAEDYLKLYGLKEI